jgi:hypothetical protein
MLYGIHPIINIVHLEKYKSLLIEFSTHLSKRLNHVDFEDLPKVEIECILSEKRIDIGVVSARVQSILEKFWTRR